MARDVTFNVTASDKTGSALSAAERHFAESQKRIEKINKDAIGKRQADEDQAAAKIGRTLEKVFGTSAPKLSRTLGEVFTTASANAGPILAYGVAAAAPLIGATLSAAIIGGAGVGGVIGGIALVKDDPRVKAAGKQLGVNLLGGLRDDAQVFVEPVLSAIGQIDRAGQKLRPLFRSIFANSAQYVEPLTTGALRGVEGILRGVEKLVAKAGPVIEQLGNSFAGLGEDAGEALGVISGGADNAADALKDVTDNAGKLIITFGWVVRALTEAYGWLDKLSVTTQLLGPLGGLLDVFTHKSDQARKKQDELADGVKLASAAYVANEKGIQYTNELLAANQKRLDDAAVAAQNLRKANQDLYGTETSVAQAFADANKAIKEHGRGLDVNTQKGRDNRTTIAGVAESINAQYKNLVAVNGVTPTTSAQAQTLRNRFVELATKAGASAAEAKNLANRLLNIPQNVKPKVTVTSNAAAASKAAKDALNSINSRTVSVTVTVNTSRLDSVERRLSRLHGVGIGAAATEFWSPNQGGSGARTGGPTPVTANVVSQLYLDSSLIWEGTARQIRAESARDAWRQKVGRR